jgi:hypothetical protein
MKFCAALFFSIEDRKVRGMEREREEDDGWRIIARQ